MFAGAASMIALIAPTIMATNALKGYDSNMRRFMAVTGSKMTTTALSTMNSRFNELAITYGESAENIAAMAIEFGKAGFSADRVVNDLLEPALQLAIANQMDSATAAEISTYAWQLWGKEIGNFTTMANMMHVAASESILDVEDLAEAFQYVGSSAVLNNITFQQFLALAGGVSQVAAQMGESFRSLFINMMMNGQQLADTLNAPEIMDNGKVNLMALVSVLKEGNYTIEQWNAAMGLWGLRPATNLNQIKMTAEEIERIFSALGEEVGALPAAADMMSMSLDRLIQSIMETIVAPLRTTEVMEEIRSALKTVQEALGSEAFVNNLKALIAASAEYVKVHGPELIQTVTNLLRLFVEAIPTLQNLAEIFLSVAGFVSKLNANVLILIVVAWQFIKLAPQWITTLINIGVASSRAAVGMSMLGIGVMGFVAGIMMLITSNNPAVRAIGALTIAFSALATALAILTIVGKSASFDYAGIVMMLAAIGTVGGIVAGTMSQTLYGGTAPAATGVTPTVSITGPPSGGGTNNIGGDINVSGDLNVFPESASKEDVLSDIDSWGGRRT